MSHQTEERLRRAGHEIRHAVAGLPAGRAPGGARRPHPAVIAGLAAATVVAVLAVRALLRSGGEDVASPVAVGAPELAQPAAAGVAATETGLGDVEPAALVPGGDGLLLLGRHTARSNLPDPVVLTTGVDAAAWRTVTETVGDGTILDAIASGDTVLALSGLGGADSTLYRSADAGATWAAVQPPVPDGFRTVVVQQLATTAAGEFLAGGIATSAATFDESVAFVLWRSPDGTAWNAEPLTEEATLAGAAVDSIAEVDGRLVVLARALLFDPPWQLLALEEPAAGEPWAATDVMPVLASQAGAQGLFVNTTLVGAGLVDGHLAAWWSLSTPDGGSELTAMARRAGPGAWEAKPLTGPAPDVVAFADDGVVGLARPRSGDYPGPDTELLVSHAGVSWTAVAAFEDVHLTQLAPTGPGELVAAGVETSLHPDGYSEPGDGVTYAIELGGSILDLIGSEPGG